METDTCVACGLRKPSGLRVNHQEGHESFLCTTCNGYDRIKSMRRTITRYETGAFVLVLIAVVAVATTMRDHGPVDHLYNSVTHQRGTR